MTKTDPDWTETPREDPHEIMYVDVDGYEGPLDLLLDLARRQKVDLHSISVLALAEQYLAFIETIRQRRIEVAADYLVMAAWLAYLKTRLMVPQAPADEEPSGEMLAAALQFRLKRLEAMRQAVAQLMGRPRLGISVFARGMPQPAVIEKRNQWDVGLYELLKTYANQRERDFPDGYSLQRRTVWSLQDARDMLQRLIGDSADWVPLQTYLLPYMQTGDEGVTALASTFTATLELARQGHVELRQAAVFGPLFLRRRDSGISQAAE